jgi:hypothetical protein
MTRDRWGMEPGRADWAGIRHAGPSLPTAIVRVPPLDHTRCVYTICRKQPPARCSLPFGTSGKHSQRRQTQMPACRVVRSSPNDQYVPVVEGPSRTIISFPGWLPQRYDVGGWLGERYYFVRMSLPVFVMRRMYSSPSCTMMTSRAPCMRSVVVIRLRCDHEGWASVVFDVDAMFVCIIYLLSSMRCDAATVARSPDDSSTKNATM